MVTDNRDAVADWVADERAGRPDEADRTFSAVARSLPKLGPSQRFSADVMRRISAQADVAQLRTWPVAARLAIAASIACLGLALGGWTSRSMLLAAGSVAQALVWAGHQLLTGSLVWVEAALTTWGSVAHAAVVVGRQMVAPGPAALVFMNMAMALAGFVALQRLLKPRED
jgi:hypothetical protein